MITGRVSFAPTCTYFKVSGRGFNSSVGGSPQMGKVELWVQHSMALGVIPNVLLLRDSLVLPSNLTIFPLRQAQSRDHCT